jgi:hypothetical protein
MSYYTNKYDNANKHDDMLKITNINKINRVSRHLDDLLISIHHRIGNIMYMHTYRRSSHNNNTTSCFIQLENWQKHTLLAEILNQLDFHGTQLRAEETSFNFQFDDNEHSPRGIGCSLCTHAIKDKKSHHATSYSISPPPYTLDTPPHNSLKRKCDPNTTSPLDQIKKQSKVNHNQINYIPLDSDSSNDSQYSTINHVKNEPTTALIINLPQSISNMQLHTLHNQQQTTTPQSNIITTPFIDTTIPTSQLLIDNITTHSSTTPSYTSTPSDTSTQLFITSNSTCNLTNKTPNIRCSSCHTALPNDSEYFKPIISLPQTFNQQCPHQYCINCFTKLTIIKHDNQYAWDGYPMIEQIYSKRHNTTHIFTCQLCRLFSNNKE